MRTAASNTYARGHAALSEREAREGPSLYMYMYIYIYIYNSSITIIIVIIIIVI